MILVISWIYSEFIMNVLFICVVGVIGSGIHIYIYIYIGLGAQSEDIK